MTTNPECVGEYSFADFIASAVCYMQMRYYGIVYFPTGRYVGIMTTKKQFLQLCEVEIYSRGNSILEPFLNVLFSSTCISSSDKPNKQSLYQRALAPLGALENFAPTSQYSLPPNSLQMCLQLLRYSKIEKENHV